MLLTWDFLSQCWYEDKFRPPGFVWVDFKNDSPEIFRNMKMLTFCKKYRYVMINRARVEDFETLQIQIIPSIVANEFLRNSCAQRGKFSNVSLIFIHTFFRNRRAQHRNFEIYLPHLYVSSLKNKRAQRGKFFNISLIFLNRFFLK